MTAIPQRVPQYPAFGRWPTVWAKRLLVRHREGPPPNPRWYTFQGPGQITQLAGRTYLLAVAGDLKQSDHTVIIRFTGQDGVGWIGEELGEVEAFLGQAMSDLPTYLMEILL